MILLVEDNALFSNMLTSALADLDIRVVSTLAAAKRFLSEHCVRLILLDLGLPDSFGLDTLRALEAYQVPKVVITGTPGQACEAARLGAMDFIEKGGDFSDIIDRISFNVSKLTMKRIRFDDSRFEQLKACILRTHEVVGAV